MKCSCECSFVKIICKLLSMKMCTTLSARSSEAIREQRDAEAEKLL